MGSTGERSSDRLRSVITGSSFIEKALLLILSGLIVPVVFVFLNGHFEQSRKNIEAQKAKDISLVEAKRNFWNEISETILTYETLALDVSWFQTSGAKNDELYGRAFRKYNEQVVDLITRWRVLISRASALSSEEVANDLQAFLSTVLEKQDIPIVALDKKKASLKEWDKQHDESIKVLVDANNLIASIAFKMGLSDHPPPAVMR